MDQNLDAQAAVEHEDLLRLRGLLDSDIPVTARDEQGWCLLCHAVDVEADGHAQSGKPLHVDVTAYLLARGADPFASCANGTSAQMAELNGHWLAQALFERHRE